MMKVKLKTYSYRFAEQVINQSLSLKNEVEDIICLATSDLSILTKETFLEILTKLFFMRGWKDQPEIFNEDPNSYLRFHFFKDRIGIQTGFAPFYCIGNDLLKFQMASYSHLDRIDLGIYITTTSAFQKYLDKEHCIKWEGALTFKKTINYLNFVKSIIQVPVYIIGVDIDKGIT